MFNGRANRGINKGSLGMGTGVLYASKSSILNVEVIP